VDLLGLGALGLVALEWLALGWLSGASFPAPPTPASWALRLLVGAVLVGMAQLGLTLAGMGFAIPGLVLAVAAAGAAAVRLLGGARSYVAHQAARPVPLTGRERLGWLVLGSVLAAATLRSLLVPEAGWDAYSHWGLRAQAYALAGRVVDAHSEHEYYPPLVPLLEAWLYLHRGLVSIDLAKTLWALVGSAFGVCLGWHLRLSLRAAWLAPYLAAGIVLGTPALLESFWTGQADLALAACLCLATLAAFQWLRAPRRAWLVQAALFGAAAALSKFEGAPRIGVVVLALVVQAALVRRRSGLVPALVLALAAGGGWLAWTLVELHEGITPNAEHLGAFQPLALGGVLLALVAVFGGLRTGGGLLIAVLAWATAGRGLLRGSLRPLALVVLGQAAATLVAFLLGATSPELEARTSATRLVEQWLPLALFLGAVGLSQPFGPDVQAGEPRHGRTADDRLAVATRPHT
jgi:hypothetical protein